MTKENLLRGQEILEELEKLSHLQSSWNNSVRINNIELSKVNRFIPDERAIVNGNFINFEELKLLVLSKIQKRIKELEEEFDSL